MEKKLAFSRDHKHLVSFRLNHPEFDFYDGVVLHFNDEIVIFHDFYEMDFDGIRILPRRFIKKVRLGKTQKTFQKVMVMNDGLKALSQKRWIKRIDTLKTALKILKRKRIWPCLDVIDEDQNTAFFLGPLTKVKKSSFKIFAYDAKGRWEKDYTLDIGEIFGLNLFSHYGSKFNRYMEKFNPPPKE